MTITYVVCPDCGHSNPILEDEQCPEECAQCGRELEGAYLVKGLQ